MAETNYNLISDENSAFLLKLYSAVSSKQSGVKAECNPLAQFAMPMNLQEAEAGMEGGLTPAAVNTCAIRGNSVTIYHDLKDEGDSDENQTQMGEDDVISPEREPLTVGCGQVTQRKGFLIEADWQDAKKAVHSAVNLGFRIGRVAAFLQAEYMLAALQGGRGVDQIYEGNTALLDAPGNSMAQMAAGAFSKKVNNLQAKTGGEIVRPLFRNYHMWDTDADTLDTPFDNTGQAAGTSPNASDTILWDKLVRLNTLIKETGNLARGEYPFHPAMISGLTADGGKSRQVAAGMKLLLLNHREYERLTLDEEWEKAQLNLSQKLGKMTGLFTGDAGYYRGFYVAGIDKLLRAQPDNTKSKVALSLLLGKGALLVTYGMTRKVDSFPNIRSPLVRKFMETVTPVNLDYWARGKTRNTQRVVGLRFKFGAVRTAFRDSNGNKKDLGVVGVWSSTK